MIHINYKENLTYENKLLQMQQDAGFDVADAELTNTAGQAEEVSIPDPSIFQDIRSRQALPKVPKVFLSNQCSFNCAYCGCRAGREDKSCYCNSPRELAEISISEARKNKSGIFVTSAIYKNADYTQELIIETLRILRKEYHYNGYLHAKIMPGVDAALIEKASTYANRLSINIEVAKNAGYDMIAKQKNKTNILLPMQQISNIVQYNRQNKSYYNPVTATSQTTQLMAGSTGETDRTILVLSKALYKKYKLSRVYYTAFQYMREAKGYELPFVSTPSWRVRRLYQADRLMELYGFAPEEVVPDTEPNLTEDLDPKISWAIRNIHLFPIEVNRADYETLLRIPGIGLTYAKRIIKARQQGTLTHETLRKLGISLKRSSIFLTCNGKYEGRNIIENKELLYREFRECQG